MLRWRNVLGGPGTFTTLTVSTSLKLSYLTAGRVPYVGADGLITDASTLTFSAGTLSATVFSGSRADLSSASQSEMNLTKTGTNAGNIRLFNDGVNFGFYDSTNGRFLINTTISTQAVAIPGPVTMSAYGAGGGLVSAGAADSGGAGFKLLRVPN